MKKLLFQIHHIPFIVIGCAAIVFAVGLVVVQSEKNVPVNASGGDIYLTSYSLQAAKGQAVPFTVRVNPGAKVDAVTATVQFNADDLEYTSVSYETSPFTTQIPALSHSPKVTVQAARMGGETVVSDSLVAVLTFTAKKDGTHTVALSEGNAAYNGMATNPLLAGKAVVRTQATCTNDDCAAKNAAVENQNPSGLSSTTGSSSALMPIEQALRSAGMNASSAQRSAPWVLALIGCGILALLFAGYLVIAKKRQFWPFIHKTITTEGVSHGA